MAQSDRVIFVPDGEALRGLRLIHRPDPHTALELQEYRERRDALGMPDPAPEAAICAKHDWRPERRGAAPPPPAAMCPACIREADHLERKAPERGYRTEERAHSQQHVNRNVDPRLERAWHQHLAEQEAAGVALAGSLAEQRAIDEADALRAKAIARDHPKRRVAASERIEGGKIVAFHHPRTRKRWMNGAPSWHESQDGEISVET